ncbi:MULTISPECIES: hypothetical protein [unclassified Arcicella]|uniref:hypothetical protein n=1 Tax=unclassified Arcicella TaxID=2644986 RepID=UPI00285DBB2E|nr:MULTISPECIES: hypothetical protein [unclassified Arcicella]MDR6561664.1 hypothetical protein [Arcicella sp. BE51]MDR6812444.1 hypothetical protein [Arcicella sp. BE140]MDR6823784.1 hypothetical protein [Arcicella sp. BE139]
MWDINTIWFDVTLVTFIFLFGNIFLGHFEERSPKWRKLLKYFVTVTIIVSISIFFGRVLALTILGLTFIPVFYVHGVLLPRKGINGWTGEPKSKYYDFRGWDKNIFDIDKKDE